MSDYARQLEELEFEYENLREENERLIQADRHRDNLVTGLQARLSAAEESNEYLRAKMTQYDDLVTEVEELREESERLKAFNDTRVTALDDLQSRLTAAIEENERLKDEVEGWYGQGPLARKVDELRNEVDRLTVNLQDADDLQSRLSAAEAATHRSVVSHNGTINELREVRAAFKLANGRLSAAEEEIRKALAGKFTMEDKLKRAVEVIEALRQKLSSLGYSAFAADAIRRYEEGK